jgi:actin-related protein 8
MDATTKEEEEEQTEKHEAALREIRGELKWRMKNAKRRRASNWI